MPARLVAAVLALSLLLAADAAAAYRNPVLPGDYPDPSVVRVGDDFYATATSDRWAPVFPVLHSRDLVSWRQVGSVLPQAPRWARGGRFWAPELTVAGGRLLVLYAGLRRPGRFCIGVATAPAGAGPWTDRGPLTCRPGGAIDPVAVRREDGTDWLVWKAKGVGGGLWAQQVDLAALEVVGSPVPLIVPDRTAERGVTEGPTLVRRGAWWYLVHATGNCCGPPCTYVTAVARSQSLLGPYEKARRPILAGDDELRCPGHGTLVDVPDGRLFFLHHAYEGADLLNRRRQGVLTGVRVDDDGWLAMGGGGTPVLDAETPLGGLQEPAPTAYADDFPGPGLALGWQWLVRSRPVEAVAASGRLDLACGRFALLARQVAADGFRAEVTVHQREDALAALVVRERSGVQRGVEVRDGRVRVLRREGRGVRVGRAVAVPRRRPVRLVLTAVPGGPVTAAVRGADGIELTVPGRAIARGDGPTRVGLACRGPGTGRFSAFRLASTDGRPVGVAAG